MFIFIILLSILTFATAGEYDLTVAIEPGRFQCFFQTVLEKHKAMEVDYQVIDGGDLNINFMLILGANTLITESMKTEGTHRIDIKELGDYQICFDNTFSYQSRKVVFFEIFLYDALGNLEEVDITKYAVEDPALKKMQEQLGLTTAQFQQAFSKIKQNLNKIEYYQAVFRSQEARDRAIMTANYDRVLFWAVINTTALLAIGALQVYMIRSLFEDNSKIGRILRRN